MSDRVALVTGGTDGIGKEIARGLVRRGVEVVIVGRDADKGDRAVAELREAGDNPRLTFLAADLSLMREVHRLADQVERRWPRLHYLVHSAGVVLGRRVLTAEGIETNFAVTYLARFALTLHLLPHLEAGGRKGAAARIVLIGGAARNGAILFDDVNLTQDFSTLRAIWQACEAQDVFTVELGRRRAVAEPEPRVTITCLKIGVVRTNIRKTFPWWMKRLVPLLIDPWLAQTPAEAAAPAMSLLLGDEFEGVTGALFLNIRKFRPLVPSARTRDPLAGRRLWELSERLAAGGPAPALHSASG